MDIKTLNGLGYHIGHCTMWGGLKAWCVFHGIRNVFNGGFPSKDEAEKNLLKYYEKEVDRLMGR